MILEITPYPESNLPEVQLPDKEFLNRLGEQGIRDLASNHYNLLRKSAIKDLFPVDDEEFENAKRRSSDFFIQILGGHPYFNENRGKPMLVQRHAPFKITPSARVVWLECYREVLNQLELEQALIENFWHYLDVLSIRMVNSIDEKKIFTFDFKKK